MENITLDHFGELSPDAQDSAFDNALLEYIGEIPTLQKVQNEEQQDSGYPPIIQRAFLFITLMVLIPAAATSALHIYHQTGISFLNGEEKQSFELFGFNFIYPLLYVIYGIGAALMAEASQVLFQIRAAIMKSDGEKYGKDMTQDIRAMRFGTYLSTLFAFVMNWLYVAPLVDPIENFNGTFSAENLGKVLLALMPPLLVLFIGNSLKSQLLAILDSQKQLNNTFKTKLTEWKTARDNAWSDSKFVNLLGHYTWQEYKKRYNSKGIRKLSSEDRKKLMMREIRAMQPPQIAEYVDIMVQKDREQVDAIVKANITLTNDDFEIEKFENGFFYRQKNTEQWIGTRGSLEKGFKNKQGAKLALKKLIEN